MAEATTEQERLERWRLVLGKAAEESCGGCADADMRRMDAALGALYGDDTEKRKAGLGSSSPSVARWLGDIRKYFPKPVVQVMQKDALERLNLQRMLMEPELLDTVEPDIHLVANILSLASVIPKRTRDSARRVVQAVVRELEAKLRQPTEQAVRSSLNRAERTRRPRPNEIDWDRTIRRNLKNYIPEKKTVLAEEIVGFGRRRSSLRDIVLCVDQSGSMATSVVYSAVFGAVLASLRAVRTKMVLFDTKVVDLTEDLQDPVDLLFGARLGGGTDIHRALTYCEQLVERPAQTILVLVTDLYEGGNVQGMVQRAASLVSSGVHVICLLALSDDGTPSYDSRNAAAFAGLGIPTFGCTPEKFPDLMAAAIQKQDVASWAAREGIVTVREGDSRPR